MRSAYFQSYWCRNGWHERCQHTWKGAAGEPPKVTNIICDCDCGHALQKAAKQSVKDSEKWLRRRRDAR